MSIADPSQQCACAACTCSASEEPLYERNGKRFCSQACADMHPHGQPCPADDCRCEQGVKVQERTISDSQLDEAIEESFPASDPISP